MKNFDKKILIMTFFVLVIACVAIYFFTKDEDYEDISQSQLIQNENSVDNSEIIVHVDGEVLKPGIVHLYSESRISDAIEKCGGLTELADTSKINLAYKIKDGQKIHIPNIYDKDETSLIQNDAGEEIIIPDASSNFTLVNINTASKSELEDLPGIGESTALKIIDHRNKNGNFMQIEDIMNVNGIGESKFNMIKEYICI